MVTSGNDKKIFVFELIHLLNFESKNHMVNKTGNGFLNSFDTHENYIEMLQIF